MSTGRVLVATQHVECITFSLINAVRTCGHAVDLWCLPASTRGESNRYYLEQCHRFLDSVSENGNFCCANEYDFLVAEVGYLPPERSVLRRLANAASSLAIVAPAFSRERALRWKMSGGHLLRYWPLYKRHPYVVAFDTPWLWDSLSAFCRHRDIFGVDVHHTFFTNPAAYQEMFHSNWAPDASRRHFMNFVGADAPPERALLLSQIEQTLADHGLSCNASVDCDCPWFKVGTNSDAISPEDYAQLLRSSDFTLCPPGYADWSHRVIEAMVQGSIPIIAKEAAYLYGVDLHDNVNCILVGNDDWSSTVGHARTLDQTTIKTMRSSLRQMSSAGGELTPLATARGICKRIGIPD